VLSYAQRAAAEDTSLFIDIEDIRIEQVTPAGFHMYIRKNPEVASVLLTQNRWETAYCTDAWNEVNGDEARMIDGTAVVPNRNARNTRYPLIDSTPEPHAELGEAFHIYVPSTLYYDNMRGQVQAYAVNGLYVNVQTYTLSYADKQGRSQNSPFSLDLAPKKATVVAEAEAATVVAEEAVVAPEPVEALVEPEPEEAASPAEPVEVVAVPESAESEAALVESESAESEEALGTEPEETPQVSDPEAVPEAELVITEESEQPELSSSTEELPRVYKPELRAGLGFTLFSPGAGRILNEERSIDAKYDVNGEVELKQRFSDLVSVRLGFERDSLLMNRFFARGDVDLNLLSLSAGLFFGALNQTEDTFPSGVSLGLSARLFDFVALFRVDIPLGAPTPSSYTQSYSTFTLDWYPTWAHLGLSLIGRTLFQKTAGGLDITSKWVQYALFGEKSLGRFTPRLEFGYQELSWIFLSGNSQPAEYHYVSLYLGLGTSFLLTETLSLNFHLQAPVYPFVYEDLQTYPFFLNATLGVSWNL
jgi:hypothetical protein